MKISQKLKIIKNLLGLTQTELARELGVSFATLNSWLNKRSTPHKRQQQHIDDFYRKCTGQKIIPDTASQAKKEIIEIKSKRYKNIIKKIIGSPDIYEEFILSLTYNTNSIEGSTLTKDETADILFQNATLPNKDLIEHLEAKNHQTALQYLFSEINSKYKINEEFILKLHGILMNGIRKDAGQYRKHGVLIVGTNVPTANYLKVPVLMKKLIKDINGRNKDIIYAVAEIHSRFEKIHPFSDGNGRIGRLLMNAMLLKKNISPAVIKQKNKRFYYKYLNKSQQGEDYNLLESFLCDAILSGFAVIER